MAKSLTFAVDLDGVTYEWQRTVRYMLREYRGIALPPVHEFWTGWNAVKERISKDDWKWLWTEAIELGLFRYGHMTTGARRSLQQLSDMGHDICIATSRPEQAVNDTVDWISLFFKDIPLVGIHILSHDVNKNSVEADVLIDDKLENCLEWCHGGKLTQYRKALLFDRPWNQVATLTEEAMFPLKNVTRVEGWKGVLEWATIHQNKTS